MHNHTGWKAIQCKKSTKSNMWSYLLWQPLLKVTFSTWQNFTKTFTSRGQHFTHNRGVLFFLSSDMHWYIFLLFSFIFWFVLATPRVLSEGNSYLLFLTSFPWLDYKHHRDQGKAGKRTAKDLGKEKHRENWNTLTLVSPNSVTLC